MVSVDRIRGLSGSLAVKPPVAAATTANITLSGAQTIDGVAVTTGDRVLVKDQSTASDNGIYDVDTGTWTRSLDFDGNGDFVEGTLVPVNGGTNSGLWRLTTTSPAIGDSLLFEYAQMDEGSTQTLQNKTINLASNTLTGTLAEFNAALSDGDFASIAGSETLTNKTLTAPTINAATMTGVVTAPTQSANDNSTKVATTEYTDTAVGAKTVPAGAVMAFAMNSAPTGWLACDGSVVVRATYAALFTAIGTTYNTGGEAGTDFRLPDLRGYFVRGSGTNGDGTASGTFGAKQADAFESHTHTQYTNSGAGSGPIVGGGAFGALNTETAATGGTETRPANIAMLYCVKT